MTKYLPILLQYVFTQNLNMYKPLSKKWDLLLIITYRKYF